MPPVLPVVTIFRVNKQRNKYIWGRGVGSSELDVFQMLLTTDKPERGHWIEGALDTGNACQLRLSIQAYFLDSSPTNTPTPWGLVTQYEVGHQQASEWRSPQVPAGRLGRH